MYAKNFSEVADMVGNNNNNDHAMFHFANAIKQKIQGNIVKQ